MLFIACVILGASELLVAPTPALAVSAPVITSAETAVVSGHLTFETGINPEGLATSYEIKLSCEMCQPSGYMSSAEGSFPAVEESRTTSLDLTGMQPNSYHFDVLATNSAGKAVREGEFTVPTPPPSTCQNSCENTAEVPQWYTGLSEQESAKTRAEYEAKQRQAKEQEEQKAAATRAVEAEAAKRHREEEAAEAAQRERAEDEEASPSCVVPALRGDTLRSARRALSSAHCRLGSTSRPHRHHGKLIVIRQGSRPGKHRPDGARVSLVLGVKADA